jgi:hypothetical protein
MNAGKTADNGHEKSLHALVIFSDQTDLPWLRLLRHGFRHCFLAILQGSRWLIYDPLVHRTEITALDLPLDFDLAIWYRAHGFRVVATTIQPGPPPRHGLRPWAHFPIRPFTCVEAVKRVLGIRATTIFTPWQLYRHLGSRNRRRHLTNIFPLTGR